MILVEGLPVPKIDAVITCRISRQYPHAPASHKPQTLCSPAQSRRAQFVRLLDLGLVLRWTDFPGFRAAFNPGVINWDLDAGNLMQKIVDTKGACSTQHIISLAHPAIQSSRE